MLIHLVSFLGEADFLLRFPSAIFGILGVTAVYNLGKALFGRAEGLLAAFLLTLSPFHVRYSQEARAYALFAFLSVLALYFLWRGIKGHERKWWVGFIIFNILNLYTHLFALLVFLVEGLIFLSVWLWGYVRCQSEARSKVAEAFLRFWGSTTVILVCYLPMVPYLWQDIQGGKGLGGVNFTPGMTLTPALFAGVFSVFGTGAGAALLIFAAGFLAGLVGSLKKQGTQVFLALLWIGVPFGALFAFPAKHGFRPRYLVFILPLYLIFVSKGVTTLGRSVSNLLGRSSELRRPRFYAMWLLFSLLLFGVLGFSSLGKYYAEQRPNWRLAATFLAHNVAPGEIVFSRRTLPEVVLPHYRRELAEVPFVQEKIDGVDPATVHHEGGIWFIGAGRSVLPLAQQVQGSRDEPIFEVVFGVDTEHSSQAIAEGIAPAMFKDIWIAYVREGMGAEELIALYEDALSLATPYESLGIHNWLGDLFLQEGRIDEAIFHYQEAVSLDPNAPHAHYGLALAYEERGWSQLAADEWAIYRELTTE